MFVMGLMPNAQSEEGNRCTNATLKGPYGLIASGTVFTQGLTAGLTAQVSVITFDGERNVSIIGTNVSEQRGVEHITAETPGAVGTYTVNPNCTGSYALGVRTLRVPSSSPSVSLRFRDLHSQGIALPAQGVAQQVLNFLPLPQGQ